MNIENCSRMVYLESSGRVCQVCGCDFVSCFCADMSRGETQRGSKRPIDPRLGYGYTAKRFCSTEKTLRKFEPVSERESSDIENMKDMVQDSALESKFTEAPFGRRLSDAPAVVPIKKRRIQIAQVTRSPSPPPKLSPPQSRQSAFPGKQPAAGSTLLSAISSSPLASSPSPPPRSLSPRSFASPPKASSKSQPLRQSVSPLRSLAQTDCVPNKAEAADFDEGELMNESSCLVGLSTTSKDNIYQVDESFIKQDKQQHTMGKNGQDTLVDVEWSRESSEGELLRSESGNLRQDERLHWDLNAEMASWDENSGKVIEAAIKHPPMSIRKNPNESSHKNKMGYASDQDGEEQVKEQVERCVGDDDNKEQGLELETGEIRSEDEESMSGKKQDMRKEVMGKVVETREKDMKELEIVAEIGGEELTVHEEEEEVNEKVRGTIEQGMGDDDNEIQGLEESEGMVKAAPGIFERRVAVDHRHEEATSRELHYRRVPFAQGARVYPELRRGVHVAEDSPLDDGLQDLSVMRSCEDGDVPERRLPRYDKQEKSFSDDGGECWYHASEEPEFEEHVDYGDSDFRDMDEMGVDVDDRAQEESTWKEGEDDDVGHGGSQKLSSSMGGEVEDEEEEVGQMPTHNDDEMLETSLEKRARSRASGWDILPEGFDNAEEALKAAKEMPSRTGSRSVSWSSMRGRGSLASSQSTGCFGPGPPTRTTLRDGFFSGRADGYCGDRHSNEFDHDRVHYRPARRLDDDYDLNVGRGRDPVRRLEGTLGRGKVGGWMDWHPPRRHRLSSGFSSVPPVGAERENNGYLDGPGSRIGPGRRGGMRSTISGGQGSRGSHVCMGRAPPGGDVDGRRGVYYPLRSERVSNAVGRGFKTSSGPGFGGGMHERGGKGGMMDRYRSERMESRRSMSPYRPRHPLDHPMDMMSRMPSMRPEPRVVRSRSPPSSSSHHRSLGHPQFCGGRSQHSPPSRWASERREADSYHQDMDFRRPLSRSRVRSSQRTSPHVFPGSSLTDERYRQMLTEGSKHCPSLKSSIRYAHIRSRDDDSLDGGLRSNRIEGDDTRQVGGPFSRDVEFQRSSG